MKMKNDSASSCIELILLREEPALGLKFKKMVEMDQYQDEYLDAISKKLINEFTKYGLEKNDEPNPYGLRIEELIDHLRKKNGS